MRGDGWDSLEEAEPLSGLRWQAEETRDAGAYAQKSEVLRDEKSPDVVEAHQPYRKPTQVDG